MNSFPFHKYFLNIKLDCSKEQQQWVWGGEGMSRRTGEPDCDEASVGLSPLELTLSGWGGGIICLFFFITSLAFVLFS